MELIIVFIVVMVISSILRTFQRASVPADPQPELLPDVRPQEKPNYEEGIYPPAYEGGFRETVSSSYQELKRPAATPHKPVKKKIISDEKTGSFNSPLAELLMSERVILGIAVSEVLSAPRARRPFKAGGVKRS